jgi:hypothetical protein
MLQLVVENSACYWRKNHGFRNLISKHMKREETRDMMKPVQQIRDKRFKTTYA